METAYVNGILLDGTETMQPRPNVVILVGDGKILSVAENGAVPTGCQVVDLQGQYVMPGLINLHVHLPASGKPKKKKSDPVKLASLIQSNALMRQVGYRMCAGYAKTQLESGVTTLRTVGGIGDFDTRVRDDIAAGKLTGPRILASNMAVSVPGGHMAGSVAYAAQSREEAVELVQKIAAQKPDVIKLMITGGVLDARKKGEPGELKMPPEYVKACCDEAHRLGFAVAAHVESPEGVRVALENGVDTVEHGAALTDELVELFLEKKASHICTISPALPYALFDRQVTGSSEMEQYNGQVVMKGIIDCARKALAHGIPVGLGTDTGCPYITHYDMWREVFYFQKYTQVTNAFALYTATCRNAQIAGIGSETGTVQAGKDADLLVTRENPLEDLRALRTPTMVVAKGKLLRDPKPKKMPEVEAQLDRFLDSPVEM